MGWLGNKFNLNKCVYVLKALSLDGEEDINVGVYSSKKKAEEAYAIYFSIKLSFLKGRYACQITKEEIDYMDF